MIAVPIPGHQAGRGAACSATRVLLIAVVLSLAACVSASLTRLVPFDSAQGRFAVIVPEGTMDESTIPGAGPFTGSTVHRFVHQAQDGVVFAIIVGDTEPGYLASMSVDNALDEAGAANIESTHGQEVEQRNLTVSGSPAREQRIIGPTFSYVFRTVLSGSRVYSISVRGSGADITSAEAVAYLDSFAITP